MSDYSYVRQRRPDLYDGNPEPCPRCLVWIEDTPNKWGTAEMIQPLPSMAPALTRDGSGPCCPDCQAADTLHQRMNTEPPPGGLASLVEAAQTYFKPVPFTTTCPEQERGPNRSTSMTWQMCRVAVGNDRRDQYRMPGLPMGLVYLGYVSASVEDDLDRHHEWMDEHGLWPEEDEDE